MDATICVATFGDYHWSQLAWQRAVPSAEEQGVKVSAYHGETLAQARNHLLERVETEFTIFLDADDELDEGYVEALDRGIADLRAPAVSYVTNGRRRPAAVPKVAGHRHACSADCLPYGNWLVIGSAVRTELAREVEGFKDWPVYEDWDFFQRCWLAGGTVEAIPEAVYLATWRAESRNRAPDIAFKNRIHHEIVAANFDEPPA